MPLSSNSVIHFAANKESLLGILRENFRIYYCTEDYALYQTRVKGKVPMVSFCDIPLSEIKDHIGKYGNYGVGLTKDWAIRMGLNPVLYIEPNSALSQSITKVITDYLVKPPPGPIQDSEIALMDLIRYSKNYQGHLNRKAGKTPDYRFSDEREWRYAPPHDPSYEMLLTVDEYDSASATHDSSIAHLRLHFEPNDIKYILIKDDGEIAEFVNHLREVKGKYSYNDVERLMTRVITVDQIMTDM